MDAASNRGLIQQIYGLYLSDPAKGIEKLFEHLADDVKWSSVVDPNLRGLAFAKNRHSKCEVREYFEELAGEWQMVNLSIDHFTAQEDRVIVCGTGTWKNVRTGKTVTTQKFDLFRITDGVIREFCEMFDSAEVVAAATEDLH